MLRRWGLGVAHGDETALPISAGDPGHVRRTPCRVRNMLIRDAAGTARTASVADRMRRRRTGRRRGWPWVVDVEPGDRIAHVARVFRRIGSGVAAHHDPV